MGRCGMDALGLGQRSVGALENTVMNLRVTYKAGNSLII